MVFPAKNKAINNSVACQSEYVVKAGQSGACDNESQAQHYLPAKDCFTTGERNSKKSNIDLSLPLQPKVPVKRCCNDC